MTTTFRQLGLPDVIVGTLSRRGITTPFPIQAASIPDALAGRDVCGKAPTGSGKTLAFGLPLLARVDRAGRQRPRALILVPTRELAEQIAGELADAARSVSRTIVAIYGGVGYGPQRSALRRGADVIVATPGRLEDLLAQGDLTLDEVEVAVLDEADRMADMGFLPAVRRILDLIPATRQTHLFSATLDGDIAVLSRDYQHRPVRHETREEGSGEPASHHFWMVEAADRVAHAAELIASAGQSIVFTRTRHGADRLAGQLERAGIGAISFHGGQSQRQRTGALARFTSGQVPALVATDVAARGIHVDSVAAVIHFDPPADVKDYQHRSGRTARAGAGGKVVSLVTPAQRRQARAFAKELGIDPIIETPRPDAWNRSSDRAPRSTGLPSHRRSERRGTVASPLRSLSIYVANLPWRVTSEDLAGLFRPYGVVEDSAVVVDRRSGRSRGFGFVAMEQSEARVAIAGLNGSRLDGRDLKVREARPRVEPA